MRPAQTRPHAGEPVEGVVIEALPRDVGGVERTGRGAYQQVGAETVVGERLQHADLDGSAGGAAGEDEDVSGLVRLLGHGTSLCLAPDPESLPGCRGESSNACPI